jgi:hypothetical protein
MASWQARLAAFFVRHRIKPALGDMRDIARVRAVFATRLPVPRGVRFTPAELGGVPGEWVEAADPIAAGAARHLTSSICTAAASSAAPRAPTGR